MNLLIGSLCMATCSIPVLSVSSVGPEGGSHLMRKRAAAVQSGGEVQFATEGTTPNLMRSRKTSSPDVSDNFIGDDHIDHPNLSEEVPSLMESRVVAGAGSEEQASCSKIEEQDDCMGKETCEWKEDACGDKDKESSLEIVDDAIGHIEKSTEEEDIKTSLVSVNADDGIGQHLNASDNASSALETMHEDGHSCYTHYNCHCQYYKCGCSNSCKAKTGYHNCGFALSSCTKPQSNGYKGCWGAGNDKASRDKACSGNLVCARDGYDSRDYGECSGHHCCSSYRCPKGYWCDLDVAKGYRGFDGKTCANANMGYGCKAMCNSPAKNYKLGGRTIGSYDLDWKNCAYKCLFTSGCKGINWYNWGKKCRLVTGTDYTTNHSYSSITLDSCMGKKTCPNKCNTCQACLSQHGWCGSGTAYCNGGLDCQGCEGASSLASVDDKMGENSEVSEKENKMEKSIVSETSDDGMGNGGEHSSNASDNASSVLEIVHEDGHSCYSHYNCDCSYYKCGCSSSCKAKTGYHNCGRTLHSCRQPQTRYYQGCWNAGSTTASRDAGCAGSLVCARDGYDGRDYGDCSGHHCCSIYRCPKGYWCDLDVAKGYRNFDNKTCANANMGYGCKAMAGYNDRKTYYTLDNVIGTYDLDWKNCLYKCLFTSGCKGINVYHWGHRRCGLVRGTSYTKKSGNYSALTLDEAMGKKTCPNVCNSAWGATNNKCRSCVSKNNWCGSTSAYCDTNMRCQDCED